MKRLVLNNTLQTTICSLFLVFSLSNCAAPDPLDIPEPQGDFKVEIERLDVAWFEMSAIGFREQHPRWQEEYGELYTRYVEDVLNLGKVGDSNLFSEIRGFTTNENILEVKAEVDRVFPNLDGLESEFTAAWKYYQYYFPTAKVPELISFNGGFNTPALLTSEGLGIGLEMYLGEACEFYDYLQIPVYLRHRMTPDHVVPMVMKGWIETEHPLTNPTPSLLETIVQQGKVLYCLDAILPKTPDHRKIFYSQAQLEWAHRHEPYVWAHFIDNELLFSTERAEISKFTHDGPFTVDLVKESPSRMGYFIGWQIVRAYMQKQETVNLPALMGADPEDILNQSKYKP
ncbi:MAG: hypothetical protein RLP15_00100 [Cryomorphaceae bacterium]